MAYKPTWRAKDHNFIVVSSKTAAVIEAVQEHRKSLKAERRTADDLSAVSLTTSQRPEAWPAPKSNTANQADFLVYLEQLAEEEEAAERAKQKNSWEFMTGLDDEREVAEKRFQRVTKQLSRLSTYGEEQTRELRQKFRADSFPEASGRFKTFARARMRGAKTQAVFSPPPVASESRMPLLVVPSQASFSLKAHLARPLNGPTSAPQARTLIHTSGSNSVPAALAQLPLFTDPPYNPNNSALQEDASTDSARRLAVLTRRPNPLGEFNRLPSPDLPFGGVGSLGVMFKFVGHEENEPVSEKADAQIERDRPSSAESARGAQVCLWHSRERGR
jgi:hypothetical protein